MNIQNSPISYKELFPYDILCFNRLISKIYMAPNICKCTCFSGIWKAFLLFPRFQPIYLKEDWIPILVGLRTKVPSQEELSNIGKKISPSVKEKIQFQISTSLKKINKINNNITDITNISNIIFQLFFVEKEAMVFPQLQFAIHWTCRFYFQFFKESMPETGTAESFLLSREHIIDDVYLCVQKITNHNTLFVNNDFEQSKNHLYQQFQTLHVLDHSLHLIPVHDNVHLNQIKQRIIVSYANFFEPECSAKEIPVMISALLAFFPDLTLFHYFFHCICSFDLYSSKDNQVHEYPMELFIKQAYLWKMNMEKQTKSVELCICANIVDSILLYLKDKDTDNISESIRKLIQESFSEISLVVSGEADSNELIPFNCIIKGSNQPS